MYEIDEIVVVNSVSAVEERRFEVVDAVPFDSSLIKLLVIVALLKVQDLGSTGSTLAKYSIVCSPPISLN